MILFKNILFLIAGIFFVSGAYLIKDRYKNLELAWICIIIGWACFFIANFVEF